MRGRATFSVGEIHRIESSLRQLRRADPRERRRLQCALRRRHGFYVSDFARPRRGLTAEDVERLISQGVIRVRV